MECHIRGQKQIVRIIHPAYHELMSNRLPSWDVLAAFLAVHRTGSLSGAARSLGLSQPTVRRQIEALETHVGAPLFLRAAAGLIPVDGSDDLVAEVMGMEAAAAAFARRASAPATQVSGVVRVTCSAVFAVEILPPALTRLRESWPDLELEISVSNRIENILRRDADIAVRLAAPTQDATIARRVAPVTFGLFAAPGPVAEAARAMDWPTLAQSGLLILQDKGRTLEDWLQRTGHALPRRAALRTDDDLAQLAAIRAGVGVGITQVGIAARDGLVPICPSLRLVQDVWIAMHEDQRRLRRVRTVFDALVTNLDPPTPHATPPVRTETVPETLSPGLDSGATTS